MNDKIRTPSLAEVRAAGYKVDISHRRLHKVAYTSPQTGKLVVHNVCHVKEFVNTDSVKEFMLFELLPKGGLTEVTVTDPVTNLEFFASSRCHEVDNYDKRAGVEKCLERIIGLMVVCEWKGDEGFKVRLQC